jgi:hypothetical protein
MGTYSGSALINELATRLRDPSNTGYPRATVLNIINRVQDAVNVRLGLVHATASFTTTPGVTLYQAASIASNFAYVRQAFDDNNIELDVIPYKKLVEQDPRWIHRVGPPQVVSQIGRTIIVVTPTPLRPTSVTIKYVKHPTALADAGSPTWDLPDEHKPLVLDLAEAVLLFRGRQFRAMQEALTRAAPKLGLEDAAQILRHGTVGEKTTAKPQSTAGVAET